MTVYFFDDNQQLSKTVSRNELIECIQEKELSESKDDLMKNTLKVTVGYDKVIEESSFMAVKEKEDEFSLYRILTNADNNNKLSTTGSDFAYNELDGYIVKEIRPQKESISSVARRLLDGTEWQIRHVDSGLGTVSGSFYYTSIRESLKTLQTFGCEIEFRCSLNSDGIHEKWINIYKRIGENTGKRFTYGDDVLEVVKTIDRTNLYTSVIGRGKGEEVGETEQGDATYGRRIEFADIEWSKSKGDPLDKPKGQIFIENKELTKIYGIPQKDGTMRKRETVVIFEDEEEPSELIKKTYDQLQLLSRPLMQFKTTVMNGDVIGNTVSIHHFEKGYHYETRVFKTTLDMLTGHLECGLGDNIMQSVSKSTAKQINSIKTIEEKKTSYRDASEISKWQSDVIRGAGEEGGNVFMMSPSDLGKGDSRAPFQTVWMNGPNIKESDNFLVANNKGIGFIKGKFDSDKFATAWTIDGVLTLGEGMLQIGTNEGGRFLETTDKGLQFFKKNLSLGRIGTSSESFWGTMQSEEKGKPTDKSIAVELDDEGEFIQLLGSEKVGLYIPNVKKNPKGSDILLVSNEPKIGVIVGTGSSGISFGGIGNEKKVNISAPDGLFLNGKEVFSGQGGGQGGGGGGWNGQYPPEVTSSADKFAWELWSILTSKGYSKAAAAGILGNVQGEVGIGMNPDTEQQGGPAYGCVQWDGSAYPLKGPPTWNGRQYVQTLMDAAKINDDYKTMKAQGQLIDWCNYNGQWIGQVSPTSVNGFKNETNPKQAAYAFELNFERPAAAHPERQGWAEQWYNKFVNLKPPVSSGKYVRPMNKYVVTSEFGWRPDPFGGGGMDFHNAIDLANGGGSQIFASNDGVVVQASGDYWDWYGNYVVIQHADGLFTGYAHLSSIKVARGQQVSQGQLIGLEGGTGPVTGAHLHFQFSRKNPLSSTNDDFINPRKYVQF